MQLTDEQIEALQDLFKKPGWDVFENLTASKMASAHSKLLNEGDIRSIGLYQGKIKSLEWVTNLPREIRLKVLNKKKGSI